MQHAVANDVVLSEIVERLVLAVDPDRIILFGSRARGQSAPRSDIDLMIVKASEEPRYRRAGRAHRALIGIGVPIDIVWCTPEEAEERSKIRHHLASLAAREGRILYERKP